MDAAQGLSDLTEISSQIEAAVILDADGSMLGSTLDEARSRDLATSAQELLAAARRAAGGETKELSQLEAATSEGSVFLVRDGQRTIAATTGPEPTVGLVFYDLKACLRVLAQGAKPKPKPRRAPAKSKDDATA